MAMNHTPKARHYSPSSLHRFSLVAVGTNNWFLKYIPLTLIFLFISCSPKKVAKLANTPQIHIVEILAGQFEPPDMTIDSGDVIKWINKDFAIHQLVSYYGENIQSSVLGYGESVSLSFKKSTSYACIIHPEMLGVVKVR